MPKQQKSEVLAVVIGRNRRVYARIYKRISCIEGFSKHYYESEIRKSYDEGFRPVGMKLDKPNDTTWVYHVQYEAI